eukprot:m.118025 g.118025  ORF g.118025 m.118025 type:complete len:811 (+) comp15558_c0_seq1:144-2576(+)
MVVARRRLLVGGLAVIALLSLALWAKSNQQLTVNPANSHLLNAPEAFVATRIPTAKAPSAQTAAQIPTAPKATQPKVQVPSKGKSAVQQAMEEEDGEVHAKAKSFNAGEKTFANHPRCAKQGPVKKIMYIKTHKTGSSTLANMFHRFTVKHNLSAALPRDNLFYAWPHMDPERIKSVVWQHNQFPDRTYDILCSAHVRYSAPALDALVPDAQYITVLRSPVTHVKSSWSYWGIPTHILGNKGPHLSLEEFVSDPNKYWSVANRGDKFLLLNNQCFDLGLNNEPDQAAVDALRTDMDRRFFSLITDHMDESLVLLKKEMCWDLEDVLYISLKSRSGRPKSTEDIAVRLKREQDIRRMNWADQQLFDHFNATLWKKIAQYPDFDAELAEYRRLVDVLSEDCSHLSNMDEHKHRRVLEEWPDLTDLDRRCHYTLMDSMAFSKHLKKLRGAAPTELECHTQGMPRKTLFLQRLPNVPDSILLNIIFRYGLRRDLPLLIPKPNVGASTPFTERYMHIHHRNPKKTGAVPYNVGVSPATLPFDARVYQLLEKPLNRLAMIMDPVQHFVQSYRHLKVADFLKKKGFGKVDLARYVLEPAYRAKLPLEMASQLHNGQLRGLGYTGLDVPNRDKVAVGRHVREVIMNIENIFVEDRFIDSLLLFRRQVCLPLEDLALSLTSANVPEGATPDRLTKVEEVPSALRKAIREAQWADQLLYQGAVRSIDRRLLHENDVPAEQAILKQYINHMTQRCKGYQDKPDSELEKGLVFTPGAYFNMVVGNVKNTKADEHALCLAANVPEAAMLAYLRKDRKTRYIYD